MTFLSFEGCDFSGKTTQIELLAKYLQKKKKKILLTREPGGTKLAEKIRELLCNSTEIKNPILEYLLLAAARIDHVSKIQRYEKLGYLVISDRFFHSSVCYQGYMKGLSLDFIEFIKQKTIYGYEANCTILLTITEEEIAKRVQIARKNHNSYDAKSVEFHVAVNQSYLKIAESNPSIVVVDGNRDANKVHHEIKEILEKKLLSAW